MPENGGKYAPAARRRSGRPMVAPTESGAKRPASVAEKFLKESRGNFFQKVSSGASPFGVSFLSFSLRLALSKKSGYGVNNIMERVILRQGGAYGRPPTGLDFRRVGGRPMVARADIFSHNTTTLLFLQALPNEIFTPPVLTFVFQNPAFKIRKTGGRQEKISKIA